MDALHPAPSLLSKLGSIVVHAEEALSADGHPFDKAAIETLLADPEFIEWRRQMDAMALLPKKRR